METSANNHAPPLYTLHALFIALGLFGSVLSFDSQGPYWSRPENGRRALCEIDQYHPIPCDYSMNMIPGMLIVCFGTRNTPLVHDPYWILDTFYANIKDSRLIVPKPQGEGKTMNFGHCLGFTILLIGATLLCVLIMVPMFYSSRSLHIKINGKSFEASENKTILDVCKENGIDIPSLCSHSQAKPMGKCNLGKVDVSGQVELQSSCSTQVQEGMEIWTTTPRVVENQLKEIKNLYSSVPNKQAFETKTMKDLLKYTTEHNNSISVDYMKCISCDRCVTACSDVIGCNVFASSSNQEGFPVGYTNGISLSTSPCLHCGQCSLSCPTGALSIVSHASRVAQAIHAKKTIVMIVDPSIQQSIGSLETQCNGTSQQQLQSFIGKTKSMGIQYVFDGAIGNDLYIQKVSSLLLQKINGDYKSPTPAGKKPLPIFTSSCPATNELFKQLYPQMLPAFSPFQCPPEMLSSVIKGAWAKEHNLDPKDIYIVDFTSCVAAKNSVLQTGSFDAVLIPTEMKELETLLLSNSKGLSATFDAPYNNSTSSASLSTYTGGLLEAILRETTALINPTSTSTPAVIENCRNIKTSQMFVHKIKDSKGKEHKLRCVAVNSKYIQPFMEKVIKGKVQYDLVELYACPEGCIGSAGFGDLAGSEECSKRREFAIKESNNKMYKSIQQSDIVKSLSSLPLSASLSVSISQETQQFIDYIHKQDDFINAATNTADPNDILILYGTQGGTSLAAAQQIETQLKENHLKARVKCMEDIQVKELNKEKRIILVCCTYGQGDFPKTAKQFWNQLNDKNLSSTFFKNIEYGVFGLGSSAYKKFNEAGRLLDDRMCALGGKRLLPRAAADETKPGKYSGALEDWFPQYMKSINKEIALYMNITPAYKIARGMEGKYLNILPPNGFKYVPCTKITSETAPGYDREIRLFNFDIRGTGLSYNTGDHAAIYPRNSPRLIEQILDKREIEGDKEVYIQPQEQGKSMKWPETLPVSELFEQYFDMNTAVTKQFLRQIYNYVEKEEEKKMINYIVTNKEALTQYTQSTTIGDCLQSFSSLHIPLDLLISILPHIQPRLYSIASSSLMHPQDVQLAIGLNFFKQPAKPTFGANGEYIAPAPNAKPSQHNGLTTGYLWDLDAKNIPKVAMSIHKGILYLPKDPMTPTIYMSLGTGVAPFRAFLQEREEMANRNIKMGPCTYYYGCRYEDKDFVFGDYAKSLVERGIIDKLECAFSRPNHYHIDQVMRERPEYAFNAANHPNVHSYYCGISRGVPESLIAALGDIYEEKSTVTDEEKQKKREELQQNFHEECF
ncbi:hypothetical protein WA158_007800 [Blastocystis sp. Blastoise]